MAGFYSKAFVDVTGSGTQDQEQMERSRNCTLSRLKELNHPVSVTDSNSDLAQISWLVWFATLAKIWFLFNVAL